MSQVTRRDLSWAEIVQKAWGKEWTAPTVAYEFSNGRKFYDTGRPLSGDGRNGSDYADDYADDYA